MHYTKLKRKYRIQKLIREQNIEKILAALNERPRGFNELQRITDLSPRAFDNIRRKLLDQKIIQKDVVNGKPVYNLTDKGIQYHKGMWKIFSEMFTLKEKEGTTYMRYNDPLGMGITNDVIKNLHHSHFSSVPIGPTVKELRDFVLHKLLEDIEKRKISVKPAKGKIVLVTTINYDILTDALIKGISIRRRRNKEGMI